MIVYLGNKLLKHGKNPTSVDVLGKSLADLDPTIIAVSDKQNFVLRILDMWLTVLKYRNKADYVLIDTYSTQAFHFAWSSAWLCRLLGLAYIPIIHGGDFEKRIKASPTLVKFYLSQGKAVVTPSGFLSEVIDRQLGIPSVIIPNAVRLEEFSSEFRASYQEAPRIFWLRAYQEIYSPVLAIEILRELHQQLGQKAELVMVGPDKDGSYAKVKDKISSYGLQDYVSLYLKFPKKDWLPLAAASSVFLNTTTVDNTPVSVIEGMALGLPIVSSRVGGIPFLIRENETGYLYECGDFQEAARLIHRLHLDSQNWKRISENALHQSHQMDWDTSVKNQWKNLLEKNGQLV